MGFNIFTLVVWGIVLGLLVWIYVVLGSMPGKVAAKRNHPNKDAIRIGGWVTLLLAPPAWAFVLMWAYCTQSPVRVKLVDDEIAQLRADNAELRQLLQEAGAEV